MPIKESISAVFKEQYNEDPHVVARAPGRINIIGEHTDYNDGFVLPAAINQHSVVALSKRNDKLVSLYSVLFEEKFEIDLGQMKPQEITWTNYVLGVVDQFVKDDQSISGFNLVLDGNVPLGAGLSSSASVECATAFGLRELFNLDIADMKIAQLSQLAEHTYAGVNCGIMDQFASVFGKEDYVVRLDCRDLTYKYFPLELEDYGLLLLNTNVEHSLASTAYNKRRETCEKAVDIIQKKYAKVDTLRDVTYEMLDELIKEQHPDIYPKAKYVVGEIERVKLASKALQEGDLQKVGELMNETHEGLSKCYEVSCDELDFLFEQAKKHKDILGARVMGGGFGGCTINLIKKDFIEEFIETVKPLYKEKFGIDLTPIKVGLSKGAHIL